MMHYIAGQLCICVAAATSATSRPTASTAIVSSTASSHGTVSTLTIDVYTLTSCAGYAVLGKVGTCSLTAGFLRPTFGHVRSAAVKVSTFAAGQATPGTSSAAIACSTASSGH